MSLLYVGCTKFPTNRFIENLYHFLKPKTKITLKKALTNKAIVFKKYVWGLDHLFSSYFFSFFLTKKEK
jgi:hypothetical protein